MKARFYDPLAGRFLQPDSIVPEPGNPQSLNRYSYGYNNPMMYNDPTGHVGSIPRRDPYSIQYEPPVSLPAQPQPVPGPLATPCPLWVSCGESAQCGVLTLLCAFLDVGGVGVGFGAGAAMNSVVDFCSVFTPNTLCGLPGGHSVSLSEWGLSVVGVGLLLFGPEGSELEGTLREAAAAGRAAEEVAEAARVARTAQKLGFTQGQLRQFERQLEEHGIVSLEKSRASLVTNLQEHIQKLED